MNTKTGKEKQAGSVARGCCAAMTLLLMHFTAASADPVVAGGWVQRAAEQQAMTADQQASDEFRELEVIGLDELGDMRGGLAIAGLDIDVGAVVRTIVDGQLALESQISLTSANAIAAAVNGNPRSTAGTAAAAVTPQAAPGNNNSAASVSNVVIQPASGATTPLTSTSNSVVINDTNGLTQVMHDLTRNRVVSAIFNQASQRQIRQEIDIDITVSNFREVQRAAAQQRVSRALSGVGL